MNEQGNHPSSGLSFCLSHRVRRLEGLNRLSLPLEDKGSCRKSFENNRSAMKNSCKTMAAFFPVKGDFTRKPQRRLPGLLGGLEN